MKMNLQLFAEAVQGKKLVYLFRIKSKAAEKDATTLALTTENTRTKSKDSDTTVTKDGSIRTPGAIEQEISATALLPVGDEVYDEFEAAMENDELIEVWEANLAEPIDGDANKFKGMYMQGYLTEFELSSSAEDHVEVSTTFAINGAGVKGEVTVSAEQQEVAAYAFADTQKTGA